MAEQLGAPEMVRKCKTLKGNWATRDKKIRDWYKILRLKDELAQEGMESVVSNDPKTGFNLGKHLLISSFISHKIDSEGLTPTQVSDTSYIESYLTKIWAQENERYRRTGRQKFVTKLAGFLLATGWYSIFGMATKDRVYAEIWNPICVYPNFGMDSLLEAVHIYNLTPEEANFKIRQMEWKTKNKITKTVPLYNYWGLDEDSDVINAIVLGQEYVKPPDKDLAINRLIQKTGELRLPVFCGPVGGLPDEGDIVQGKEWQENLGEALVATNEGMTLTYNKMLSFIQQTARSAAQHRWYDRTSVDTPILSEENIDKWGAIYHLGPNDEVGTIDQPQIPVELRTIMYEYSNMVQRGLFPWVLHGNLQQQLSYLAMANVASSAIQQLEPYVEGLEGVFTDLDNFWINMLLHNNLKPHGFKKPSNLPDEFRVRSEVEVQIPGYLVQRAQIARMMNPDFRLPQQWIVGRMFPEIKDPLRTQADVRSEIAMMNPDAIKVDSIIAYREQAQIIKSQHNNPAAAALYEKLAAKLESELDQREAKPNNGNKQASEVNQTRMIEGMDTI